VLLVRVNGASGKRRPRGVEVRERARGGEHRYAYRVRYLNAQGQRKARTFDTPQDAMDFRGRLRLLKRAGDLAALDLGRDSLEQFSRDYWRLYAEVRLASRTAQTYRSLWNCHVRQRLGGMQLRQITPLVVSVFVSELQDAGASVQTVRACLSLLQSMFSRAVEWDRVRINVVKLVAKPRAPQTRAVKPLLPADVEAIRAHMLANRRHGLTDATLVSVLAYAGLRPQEALALEWRHLRENTLVIEQRCVDEKILPGQKTTRPPRSIPLFSVLRGDLREHQLACRRSEGLIFQRAGEIPWRTSDWREWRVRVWQPACEAIGLATITHTTSVLAGKHKTTRNYRGPVPYHLRHSFASLLIHEGQHSLVQISEWLGHSTLTVLRNYAHVIADVAGRSLLPSEHAIKTARAAPPPHTCSNSTGPNSTQATTRWLYG
jgi:integrase